MKSGAVHPGSYRIVVPLTKCHCVLSSATRFRLCRCLPMKLFPNQLGAVHVVSSDHVPSDRKRLERHYSFLRRPKCKYYKPKPKCDCQNMLEILGFTSCPVLGFGTPYHNNKLLQQVHHPQDGGRA
jgi:hypothetical protein